MDFNQRTMGNPDGTLWADAEVISVYTRAQAIADGALIDITETAREKGFKYPVAMTRAAWGDFVAWIEADNQRKGTFQDEAGRLWDVLTMLWFAARRCAGDTMRFQVLRVPREGRGRKARIATLKAVIGPGDDCAPCEVLQGVGGKPARRQPELSRREYQRSPQPTGGVDDGVLRSKLTN